MSLQLLALLAAATAATPTPDIIVTADRLSEAEVRERSQAYVKGVLPVPVLGQYARWQAPVCIKVAGVDDAIAARVVGRIITAASDAGIRTAPAGCAPNIVVLFSADARADVATILRKKPGVARNLDGVTRRLLGEPGLPVRWWHTTSFGGSDGAAMTRQSQSMASAQYLNNDSSGTAVGGPEAPSTSSYSASLIDTHVSVAITQATAAVDVPLTTGRSLDAIADYVALVTLARVQLGAPAPGVASVLGMFARAPGDDSGLTAWDRAYLAALPGMTLNRKADRQRGQLVAGMLAGLKP